MVLAVDTSGSKNATQGAGSSASYGKRHTYKAMLNIIEDGEDNDGAGSTVVEKEDWQTKLIDEARTAAAGGLDAYIGWYRQQTNMHRGYLVDQGEHAKLKEAARVQQQRSQDDGT